MSSNCYVIPPPLTERDGLMGVPKGTSSSLSQSWDAPEPSPTPSPSHTHAALMDGRTKWHLVELVPGAVDHREALVADQLGILPGHTACARWAQDHAGEGDA